MRKSQENVLILPQKHLWSPSKGFSLILLLTRGPAEMMYATRRKNQREYVILTLERKPKGCIVGPLHLLGPGNHPIQPSQVGPHLVRRSRSTWTKPLVYLQTLRKCEKCLQTKEDVVEALLPQQLMKIFLEVKKRMMMKVTMMTLRCYRGCRCVL